MVTSESRASMDGRPRWTDLAGSEHASLRWATPELRGGPMAHQQAFFLVSGIIFGLVALLHALRLAFHWQVRLRSQEIPMWLSVVGLVAAAGMCFWAFWLLR